MTSYKEARHQIHMAIHGVKWKEKHKWRGEVERIPDPRQQSISLWACGNCGEWCSTTRTACRTCYFPREPRAG